MFQVVLEYCEYGALDGYLKKNDVPEATKILIAGDCAEGLMYLTERGFLHRDVAARNVLLNSEYRGKIADFGLSRESQDDSYYISRGGALPVRWTAPEVREDGEVSCAFCACQSYFFFIFQFLFCIVSPPNTHRRCFLAFDIFLSSCQALDKKKFSAASDVWAYGIMLYEIWTRAETPYTGMNNNKVWVEVAAGYRLPCPEDCPKEIHDRMLSW